MRTRVSIRCCPHVDGAHETRRAWCRRCVACGRGVTLIELVIAMAIIGTLAGILIPMYVDVTEKARTIKAVADIRVLEGEIAAFEVLAERLPDSLDEIGRGTLRDPWGSGYEYLNFSTLGNPGKGEMRKDGFLVPLNSTYDLYSKGKDGESVPPLRARASWDDVVRANDGGYIGLASAY